MNGKLVILIVIIVTLFGIGLAWYFLNTLPEPTKDQTLIENTILYTTNLVSSHMN